MATPEERLTNLKADLSKVKRGDVSFWIKLGQIGLRPNVDGEAITLTTQALLKRVLNEMGDEIASRLEDVMKAEAGKVFAATL